MKNYILKVKEDYAKLMADSARREIIDLLASEGEMTVTELASRLQITKATVSHHIKKLYNAGIVKVVRIEPTRGIPKKYFALSTEFLPENTHNIYPEVMNKLEDEFEDLIKNKKKRNIGDEVNISFLKLYKSALLSTGFEMDRVLKDQGYELGNNVFSTAVTGKNIEEVLESLKSFWEGFKLGKLEIVEVGKKSIIRVKDCYQCMEMPNIGKPLCPTDEGLIQGIIEAKLGGKYSVKEVKCWGTGYNFCEFEIKPEN